jgi:hypothetical protein
MRNLRGRRSKSYLISKSGNWRIASLTTLALLATLALSQTSQVQIEDEEYDVSSATLEYFRAAFLGNSHLIVIWATTVADDDLQVAIDRIQHPPENPRMGDPALRRQVAPAKKEEARKWLADEMKRTLQNPKAFATEISDQTILDWTRKSRTSSPLSNKFHMSTSVVILSETDTDRMKKAKSSVDLVDFWAAFRRKYPEGGGGIVRISRTGFNRERTQAIVEVGNATGPVGGQGVYVLLGKENGVWKVHYSLLAWIS